VVGGLRLLVQTSKKIVTLSMTFFKDCLATLVHKWNKAVAQVFAFHTRFGKMLPLLYSTLRVPRPPHIQKQLSCGCKITFPQ
jgi:hypothetical protein